MFSKPFLQILIIIFILWINSGICHSADLNNEPYIVEVIDYSNYYFKTVKSTDTGILLGEYVQGISRTGPLNALYVFDKDTKNFKYINLDRRGITDIDYEEQKTVAAAYYNKDNKLGVFLSKDKGKTFDFLGNGFSSSAVEINKGTIYIGGYSHGLWISSDDGLTWGQKIGNGWYGPKINKIKSNGATAVASADTKVYISQDNGTTWNNIAILENKGMKHFGIVKSSYNTQSGNTSIHIIAGSDNGNGIYESKDNGQNWHTHTFFTGRQISFIIEYLGGYFISAKKIDNSFGVYYYDPESNSINDTGIIFSLTPIDADIVYSEKNYLFVLTSKQVVLIKIPEVVIKETRFMGMPLQFESPKYLFASITSFFDHEYPLLGYSFYKEPSDVKNTTVNYQGIKEKEPIMYYSSHNGVDYSARIDTPVLAVDGGTAEYFYCGDCGNTIKVSHTNGYQSIYMHLKDSDLVTKNKSVNVIKGQIIGKVGMTGKTSGPHLHFAVLKDTDNDGSFLDESPQGRTDPYGWDNFFIKDPWPYHTWNDYLGTHTGSDSSYLWDYKEEVDYFSPSTNFYVYEKNNLELTYEQIINPDKITFNIKEYIKPVVSLAQNNLNFIPNSSLLLKAFNYAGEEVTQLENNLIIKLKFDSVPLLNINSDSLSFYFFNEQTSLWEKMPSIYDSINMIIETSSDHLSRFAVFAEKIDTEPPVTQLYELINPQNSGLTENPPQSIIEKNITESQWFNYFPTLKLSATDPDSLFYETYISLNSPMSLSSYSSPITLLNDGFYNIWYKSADLNENNEEIKSVIIKINSQNLRVFTAKSSKANFKTAQSF